MRVRRAFLPVLASVVLGACGGGTTTPPPDDTTPPTLASVSPTGTLAAGTAATTLSVTTSENATCRYATTAGTAYAAMTNTFSTTGGNSHSTTLSGLTDGTTYNRYIRCQDMAGNPTTADYTITFSVASTAPDTSPPSIPTGLTATAVSSSQINLSWTASTDNVGVTGYRVERCQGTSCTSFAQVGTPATNSYSDTGLTASTAYTYRLRAADAAGNTSAYSATTTATTQASPTGGVINVSTATQLANAIATANTNGGNTTIILADGTYTLTDTLYVNVPGVTIKSQSGNRASVIIQGDAMSATAVVKNLIRVAASNFTIQDVTLQKSGWHLIQIAGESNADSPVIRNVIFRDAWEQMIKISYDDTNLNVGSDNGLVENSLFEFTSGVAGQYYTGGIDAHNAKNWVVRGNTFKNIISPNTQVAEHAIHFWSSSADTLVEKNLIINCDRGIGFGLVQGRGHTRGIIRNNMIYHAAGNGAFADVAIEADESPNTQIYNNTIFLENSYSNAIEYRFPLSAGLVISNNLTNKSITARDGATATVTNNLTNAATSWFVNPTVGDLHLLSSATAAINTGTAVSGLTDDFDSQARPQGSANDIGADESQ